MPSTTITDTPTPVTFSARRHWLRIFNTSPTTVFLLVDDNQVTAEDGPHAGLPLAEGQSLILDGTILSSIKSPFTIFAVAPAGQSAVLRFEDFYPSPSILPANSLTFNGYPLSLDGTGLTLTT
jgi:hypothetical protein